MKPGGKREAKHIVSNVGFVGAQPFMVVFRS